MLVMFATASATPTLAEIPASREFRVPTLHNDGTTRTVEDLVQKTADRMPFAPTQAVVTNGDNQREIPGWRLRVTKL
jgi:hypothetical protein